MKASKGSFLSGITFQLLAAIACVLFGIALIASQELACSGSWFWYAVLHHQGKRLYTDLHMVQQPFLVLELEATQILAGRGWLASKIPALIHLIAYVVALALLSAQSRLRDWEKAIVTIFAFVIGISFEAYAFSAYEAPTDIWYLFSIWVMLKLHRDGAAKGNWRYAVVLGILSGMAVVTHVTTGTALLCTAAFAIFCITEVRRWASLGCFSAAAALTMAAIIRLTGDSYQSWLSNTILRASGAKGGAGSVLTYPLLMPWTSLRELVKESVYLPFWGPRQLIIYCMLAFIASWVLLVRPASVSNPNSIIRAIVGFSLIGGASWYLGRFLGSQWLIEIPSDVLIIASYGLALYVLFVQAQDLFRPSGRTLLRHRQVLMLLPFAWLISLSMSSGSYPHGLAKGVAFLLLLSPMVFPNLYERVHFRSSLLTLMALLAIAGTCFRIQDPISWNDYTTSPLFTNRHVYDHPLYGPMVLDTQLHAFGDGVCQIIQQEGGGDLLSIPFPFVNYYCGIPPWDDYVQTFFDTVQESTVREMTAKLGQSPPKWVLYQRQMEVLKLHERVYNQGKRLPHRDLDDFLVSKIESGQWRVVESVRYGYDSDWLLIQTR